MKIFNKFIWSKKEPSNKNDIWFDGSTWKMYTEEAWQSFTLPVDAADKVAKVIEETETIRTEVESQNQLIEDLQNTKIDRENDDYYPKMAVGLADNLAGVDVVDSEINFRRSGGGAITDGVARIESIKGNSVVWNQFFSANGLEANRATVETVNKGIKITAKSEAFVNAYISFNFIPNHKYLYSTIAVLPFADMVVIGTNENENAQLRQRVNDVNKPIAVEGIVSCTAASAEFYLFPNWNVKASVGDVFTFEDIRIIDLTQMFGSGNEPTTIEEFYARIPMGVDLNAYNEGEVIHMDVQSVESQGVNAWDEEWESGHISEGQPIPDSTRIRSKNFIKILPNTSYHSTQQVSFIFYDSEYQYITLDYSQDTTTPSNAMYMKFSCGGSVNPITTYKGDICINISDTSINGKYFSYIKRVEDLAVIRKYFPQGMKSAGSAHDEIRYNKANGKWEKVVRIGEVDMGTLNWSYEKFGDINTFVSISVNVMKKEKAGVKSARYITSIAGGVYLLNNLEMMSNPNYSYLYIRDDSYTDAASFKAAMAGVILYYELAEPIVTELDEADQFKDLDYQVWNCGTEKAIAEGKSAPLAADITYGFNAIGKIKELESLVAALRAKVGI